MTDFSKTPEEILTQLINEANGTVLPVAALRFDTPYVISGVDVRRNTSVRVHGVSADAVDSILVRYNRVHINTVPGTRSRKFVKGTKVRSPQLLAALNDAYGINLRPQDVLDTTLAEMGNAGQITIAPDSLLYYGSLDYLMEIPPPQYRVQRPNDLSTYPPSTDFWTAVLAAAPSYYQKYVIVGVSGLAVGLPFGENLGTLYKSLDNGQSWAVFNPLGNPADVVPAQPPLPPVLFYYAYGRTETMDLHTTPMALAQAFYGPTAVLYENGSSQLVAAKQGDPHDYSHSTVVAQQIAAGSSVNGGIVMWEDYLSAYGDVLPDVAPTPP